LLGEQVGRWTSKKNALMKMRKCGMDMPKALIGACFPGPSIPESNRPWHVNRPMGFDEFLEESKNWDKDHFGGRAKPILEGDTWTGEYEPLFRADFRLFDEYKYRWDDQPPFDFPIHSMFATKDYYVKKHHVEYWKEMTSAEWTLEELVDMGHLTCFYLPNLKKVYIKQVLDRIKQYADGV